MEKVKENKLKCGILLNKPGGMKNYFPLVYALANRGIGIVIYENLPLKKNLKEREIFLSKEVTAYSFSKKMMKIIHFDTLFELEQKIIENPHDFIIFNESHGKTWFHNIMNDDNPYLKKRIPMFSLQWTFELTSRHGDPLNLKYRDLYFCYSYFMKDYYRNLLNKRGQLTAEYDQLISQTFVSVGGAPIFDTIGMNSNDVILEKYGLPKDRKILLFMPPHLQGISAHYKDPWFNNVFVNNSRLLSLLKVLYRREYSLLKQAICGYRYSDLVRSVKQFCRNNNTFLIIKVREKNKASGKVERLFGSQMEIYEKYGDLVFSDESMYPFTSLELMQVSDLAVQFVSSSIFELVGVGIPSITVVLPFLAKTMKANDKEQFYEEGITTKLKVDEFISTFPHKSFSDFSIDESKRNTFIEKYLGGLSKNSSERIVEEIIRYISKERRQDGYK